VLGALAGAEGGLGVAQIARATGLNRTTIYRLCAALERVGWIHRIPDARAGRTFDLGPRVLGFSVLVSQKYDPNSRLTTIIQSLANELGETVHVGVLEAAEVVHVARALPAEGLHVAARIGSRQPAHVTALGKAMLATLTPEALLGRYPDKQLKHRSAHGLQTRRELLDEIGRTLERGYAIDDEESRQGVRCVAVPVFDVWGGELMALSVTTTPEHLAGDRLGAVADAVQRAAAALTAALGGRVPPQWTPHLDSALPA
jgi:DNA-binding IclR family transcriptional regulator